MTSAPDSDLRDALVSVVVPVFDERDNAGELVRRIAEAMRPLGRAFEMVIVDDGSRDDTLAVLLGLRDAYPELRVVELRGNFGQTAALQAGLDTAGGDVIVTMDGDLQNDPADIPMMLHELDRADVVSGWRRDRQDGALLRKFPSWVANRLIRVVTGVPIHDQGCSLKAYRAQVVRELDLYGDMHRFIAIMTMAAGAKIVEVEVQHHARTAGESKYGISRTFKVMADLFTIQMLTWFRAHPSRFFALLGTPFLLLAMFGAVMPLLLGTMTPVAASVALLLALTGGSCVAVGLLGEAVNEAGAATRPRRAPCREWNPGGER